MAAFSLDPSYSGWGDTVDPNQKYSFGSGPGAGVNQGQQITGAGLKEQYRPITDAQYADYTKANPLVDLPSATVGGQRYLPTSYFGDSGRGSGTMTGGIPGLTGSVGAPAAAASAPTATPYGNFTPPDPSAINTDPSFKFRLAQGDQALQNGAAARGTLLTGATQKGLEDYNQNAASQEYGNIFGRALQTYDTNRDTSNSNFGNSMATFNGTLAGTGQAQNFSLASSKLGLDAGQQAFQDKMLLDQTGYDRARQAWLDHVGPYSGGSTYGGAPYSGGSYGGGSSYGSSGYISSPFSLSGRATPPTMSSNGYLIPGSDGRLPPAPVRIGAGGIGYAG